MARHLERGQLRDALLAEVKTVCESDGPGAVSISAIGKRLGVSSGAPFRIFPTREHIFLALIEREMAALDERFDAVVAALDDPRAELSALCEAYLAHAKQEPAMFRLSFSVSAASLDGPDLQALGERIYGKVRAATERCLAGGTDPKVIEAKAYAAWCTVHGHAMLSIAGQPEDLQIVTTDTAIIEAAVAQVIGA